MAALGRAHYGEGAGEGPCILMQGIVLQVSARNFLWAVARPDWYAERCRYTTPDGSLVNGMLSRP